MHWALLNPSASAKLPGMGFLIGVDEAGYGPNLGPLVVAATAWRVGNPKQEAGDRRQPSGSERNGHLDLYDVLKDVVARQPADGLLAIADSKALYQPGKGLGQLERGVHATAYAARASSELPGLRTWSELIEFLTDQSATDQ